MQESDHLTLRRFAELSARAKTRNTAVFSDFLDLHAQTLLRTAHLPAVSLFGGYPEAERKMACFAETVPEESLVPIALLSVAPAAPKFAETLVHRDFLGSILALGLRREKLGDIVLTNNCGYVFCAASVADFILENLQKVRHTAVCCTRETALPDSARAVLQPQSIAVASERLDVLIAAVFHLSRSEAQKLIAAERVFADGCAVLRPDYLLKDGQTLSVRGHGRFRYDGIARETKKGKLRVQIQLYV